MTEREYDFLINEKLWHMDNYDVRQPKDYELLGPNFSEAEWQDAEIAKRLFLHTKAYEDFSKQSSLILLGRTGTGKTAIMKCIEYEIEKKEKTEYSFVCPILFDDIYKELSDFSDIDNTLDLQNKVFDAIEMIINIRVMKRLVNHYSISSLEKVKKYLHDNGLMDDSGVSFSKIISIVSDQSKSAENPVDSAAKYITTLVECIHLMMSESYLSAVREMQSFLQNKKILVLIDSGNDYDLRDTRFVVILKALIYICFSFYSHKSKYIDIKMAIPSEVYTFILQRLPGKYMQNTTVIQWFYNDLIKLIATRFLYYISNSEYMHYFPFLSQYTIESLKNIKNCSILLHYILPEYCPTSLDYSFDTIAYSIKHTLNKPRELLVIFNAIIGEIIENENYRYFYENPSAIRDVIHSTQEILIGQALSMYNNYYHRILEACSLTLSNSKYLFKGKDLIPSLRNAEAAIARKEGYLLEDIEQILLHSGLIGIVSSCHRILPNSDLANSKEVTLISVRFEYQVKGLLQFDKNSYYAIHPMCYEHFGCWISPNVLVYPDKKADRNDIINSIIKDGLPF